MPAARPLRGMVIGVTVEVIASTVADEDDGAKVGVRFRPDIALEDADPDAAVVDW